MLEKQEIKSLLVFPLKIGEKLNGFIGLDNVLVAGKWNCEDFAILRVCSEIIGNALERRQTEEALRESEEKLRSFMNSATDSFTLWDSRLNLIDVNKVGSEKFFPPGIKKKDVMGKNILDITPSLRETGRYDKYLEVLKTGKPFFADDVVPHPEFGDRYLSLKAFKVGDGLGMIVTDITELKKTEREIKQQNKINILRAEIWELAAQPLSEDELIQQLVDKVGPFFNLDSVNFMKIHPEEKAVVVEVQWQNGNKSGVGLNIPLWVLKRGVFGKPYFAPFFKKHGTKSSLLVAFGDIDNPKGYIVASDTTDRDWSEEEINVFTEAVKIISLRAEKVKDRDWSEEEINVFTEAVKIISLRAEKVKAEEKAKNHQIKIEQQNIKLRKLDQLKSDFINVTSHELRTPMASIKGYVQMLSMGSLGEITEEQEKSLEIVLRNINRLDRLIQDILDLSQLESGTMEFVPEEIDLQKMIDEVTETMRSSADIKDIKIGNEVEEQLPHLTIDPERIKQVIINLTNNAIKFSPDGSVINLKVKKEQENVLFEVEDFGRGIPKDKQERVFETFYQVDSGMKRSFGGAGLGLSISKDIIIAHEGKIWVEREGLPGKGSTFRFTLPIKSVKDKSIWIKFVVGIR